MGKRDKSEGKKRWTLPTGLQWVAVAGLFASLAVVPLILEIRSFSGKELVRVEAASRLGSLGDRLTSILIPCIVLWLLSSILVSFFTALDRKTRIILVVAGMIFTQATLYFSRSSYESAVRQHLPDVMDQPFEFEESQD